MIHVMLDLETMGTSPTSAIVAIGAVQFNPDTGQELTSFHQAVDLQDCIEQGLTVNGDTIMWWLKRSSDARDALSIQVSSLSMALRKFKAWIPTNALVWGNGAGFDNVILRNAYLACNIQCPWKYQNDRDYRTICMFGKRLGISKEKMPGNLAHNALEDARAQKRYLVEVWNALHLPS